MNETATASVIAWIRDNPDYVLTLSIQRDVGLQFSMKRQGSGVYKLTIIAFDAIDYAAFDIVTKTLSDMRDELEQ